MFVTALFDLLLALTVLFCAYFGFKRGFVRSVLTPLKRVLSLFLAFVFSRKVASALIEPTISKIVFLEVKGHIIKNCPDISPENFKYEATAISKIILSIFGDNLSGGAEGAIDSLSLAIAAPVAYLASTVLSFFAIYFLCRLAARLLLCLFDALVPRTPLGIANRVLGSAVGGIFGFIAAFGIAWLLRAFINLSNLGGLEITFHGGVIYSFFRSLSPSDLLFGLLFR